MLTAVAADLNSRWVGREDTIDALLHAIVAGEHVLITGPRGTGKSGLVRDVFNRFPWLTTFRTALNEHTDPDEILGRTQIPRIKEGDFTRDVKGRLPGCHLAFIDEITRGGQGLLDSFLPIMQEREFDNDGQMQPVPLRSFVAASNHNLDQIGDLPKWFDALDDRFLLQVNVNYVADLEMAKLVKIAVSASNFPKSSHTVSEAEFNAATVAVPTVTVPDKISEQLVQVQKTIADLGVEISDRRWMQSLKILRTSAVVNGRDTVNRTDFWSLRHVLVTTRCRKASEICGTLHQISNPYGELLNQVLGVCDRIEKSVPQIRTNSDLDKKTEWATLAQSDLRSVIRQLKSSSIDEKVKDKYLQRTEKLRRQIVDDVLGLGLESIQY